MLEIFESLENIAVAGCTCSCGCNCLCFVDPVDRVFYDASARGNKVEQLFNIVEKDYGIA